MLDLLLRRTRLLDRVGLWDVGVADGRIAQVAERIDAPSADVIDLDGRLLLRAFVDSHLHLDKAFLDEDPSLRGLTGAAFFATLKERKRERTLTELTDRMRRALETAARHGTTTVRAQIDVDEVAGLRGVEAALALKSECARWIGMQIVAFPQEGLVTNPDARTAMREALRMGAEVVGGGASFDGGQRDAHVEAVFQLATEFDADVDVHADLDTSPAVPLDSWELARIASATQAAGWQGRVTVAHLTQLGQMAVEPATAVADLLAATGIHVTVVPGAELNTATTWDDPPARSVDDAMSRFDLLLRRGVNLSYASGHVADSFNPFGCGDMLLDGLLLTSARNLGQPRLAGTHILTLGSSNPARTLRLDGPYDVSEGAIADLVCLDASEPDLALRQHAEKHLVVCRGQVAARNTVSSQLTSHAAFV
jgi:cytosine/creatinine deaminase